MCVKPNKRKTKDKHANINFMKQNNSYTAHFKTIFVVICKLLRLGIMAFDGAISPEMHCNHFLFYVNNLFSK